MNDESASTKVNVFRRETVGKSRGVCQGVQTYDMAFRPFGTGPSCQQLKSRRSKPRLMPLDTQPLRLTRRHVSFHVSAAVRRLDPRIRTSATILAERLR